MSNASPKNQRGKDEEKSSKNVVVSDALAKNSRQLLYAHLYNYLIENELYDTAKILLKEADVPVSNRREKDLDKNEGLIASLKDEELPDVKMLMTSPDTFLLEWWESLWALHSYVKETPAVQQQHQHQHQTQPSAVPGSTQFIPQPGISSNPVMMTNLSLNRQSTSPHDNNNSGPMSPAIDPKQQSKQRGPSQTVQTLQSPLPQSNHPTPNVNGMAAPSPAIVPSNQPQQLPPQQQRPNSPNSHQQLQHQQQLQQQHQQQQQQHQQQQQQHLIPPQQQNIPPGQQPRGNIQQQQQWQYNKMQQLQAQELQQRVQLQKAQLNNQLGNFANLPPQQQALLQQRAAALQAQHAAQAANGGIPIPQQSGQGPQQHPQQQGHTNQQIQHPQQQQQQQQRSQQPGHQQNQQQNQQHGQQSQGQHPDQMHMYSNQPGSSAPTPQPQNNQPKDMQQQQSQTKQQQHQQQPQINGHLMPGGPQGQQQFNMIDPSGLRVDNSAALQDYQMQLMMLENQTKMPYQEPTQQISQPDSMSGSNTNKSRGVSVAVDPLQPDPMMNQQSADLFSTDIGGPFGQGLGDNGVPWGTNGDDLELSLNAGNLNLMNGF